MLKIYSVKLKNVSENVKTLMLSTFIVNLINY